MKPQTRRTNQIDDHSLFGFCVLMAIFLGSYSIASLLATKMITVFGFAVNAGILAYSITFPITDITTEVYGERYAQYIVKSGLIAILIVIALTQTAVAWPAASFWDEPAFDMIFGASTRIFVASVTSYLLSQYIDIYIFARLRRMMHGKWIWVRNNISTAISKLIDTVSFMGIAFYGTLPVADFTEIIISGWVIHLLIAALDTPFVYAGIYWLHKAYPQLKS